LSLTTLAKSGISACCSIMKKRGEEE